MNSKPLGEDGVPCILRELSELDEDQFWQVALQHNEEDIGYKEDCSVVDEGERAILTKSVRSIHLAVPAESATNPVELKLSPMPQKEGVWSSLGADSWYSSALLTALLLSSLAEKKQAGHPIYQHLQRTRCLNALELGSGAVGLSGLALGLVLGCQETDSKLQVVLSDNDDAVLDQLRVNVQTNCKAINDFLAVKGKEPIDFSVQYLDWSNGYQPDSLASSVPCKSDGRLQLVVGSELVYTSETAQACTSMVKSIIAQNPQVLIVLVQVSDRAGWRDEFLHALERMENILIQESCLTDADLHEHARRYIQHGGTLDRFDFSVCYISKSGD